jgi:DNA-binding LacI/PurR family transcriptional regulator
VSAGGNSTSGGSPEKRPLVACTRRGDTIREMLRPDREQSLRPTIFQVAEAAGVSITTVSHVFSGKRQVNTETRRRVLDAADRLGYKARASAQALATGRSMTLGLQLSLSEQEVVLNPYFSTLLPAMSVAAMELGYSFLFLPPAPSDQAQVERLVVSGAIDGGIIIDPIEREPFVQLLIEHERPFVSIGRLLETPHDHWVDNDNAAALGDVLEHLNEQGYQSPVLLTIPARVSYVSDYSSAFGRAFPEPRRIVIARELSELAAIEAIRPLLSGPERPDSVIGIHDLLAVGVLRAATEIGLAVPNELGVIGIGDSLLAQHASPALTSVRVFPDEAGRLVVELLDQLVRGEEATAPRIVPTRLFTRTSTARR